MSVMMMRWSAYCARSIEMNNHRDHPYMREREEREPHPLLIILGAALTLAALWIVCVFLFSL